MNVTVATIGCYDLIHPGHLDFLCAAAALGDRLVVGIPNDALYERLKGRAPVMTADERAEVLSCLVFVDEVMVLDSLDYAAWVSVVEPDVLALSVDHQAERFVEAERAARRVVKLPRSPRCSTTEIMERRKVWEKIPNP